VDFFSDVGKDKEKMPDPPPSPPGGLGLAIKEDLTINLLVPAATRRDHEDKKTMAVQQQQQLPALQAELGRMNEENHRLRGMLAQVTTSYQALQMHLLALQMQQPRIPQQQPPPPPSNNSSTEVVGSPRRSSSATGNNKDLRQAPDSPDAAAAGWLPAQGRQQEASMSKARVSVRARSQAPIVSTNS
jgi:hypothetical protein